LKEQETKEQEVVEQTLFVSNTYKLASIKGGIWHEDDPGLCTIQYYSDGDFRVITKGTIEETAFDTVTGVPKSLPGIEGKYEVEDKDIDYSSVNNTNYLTGININRLEFTEDSDGGKPEKFYAYMLEIATPLGITICLDDKGEAEEIRDTLWAFKKYGFQIFTIDEE